VDNSPEALGPQTVERAKTEEPKLGNEKGGVLGRGLVIPALTCSGSLQLCGRARTLVLLRGSHGPLTSAVVLQIRAAPNTALLSL
jgi:hypothetical protein